ncbi:hypothetical protein AP057_11255 [Geobacillus sp. Sah69]|nr:hypothetical protein AP057_11255 [Geobacillus sp. Sah69]RLQ05393.1 hypothetical protein D9547_15040 [Geobacillus stearothermophilus]
MKHGGAVLSAPLRSYVNDRRANGEGCVKAKDDMINIQNINKIYSGSRERGWNLFLLFFAPTKGRGRRAI